MKLKEAAKKVCDSVEETLTYMDFPSEHWQKIRTNNVIERLNREIRRRTRVVGTFPDGNSALMLVCARLRHVAGTQWGGKKYMNMKHIEMQEDDGWLITENRVHVKGFASGFAALDALSAFCYLGNQGQVPCPVQTEFCQTCK